MFQTEVFDNTTEGFLMAFEIHKLLELFLACLA